MTACFPSFPAPEKGPSLVLLTLSLGLEEFLQGGGAIKLVQAHFHALVMLSAFCVFFCLACAQLEKRYRRHSPAGRSRS